jgi:hypothetical protein
MVFLDQPANVPIETALTYGYGLETPHRNQSCNSCRWNCRRCVSQGILKLKRLFILSPLTGNPKDSLHPEVVYQLFQKSGSPHPWTSPLDSRPDVLRQL